MTRHALIAIEGIDGSGKNTQSKMLVEWLQEKYPKAAYRDFPRYENVTGKAIKAHLHREWRAELTFKRGGPDTVDGRDLSDTVYEQDTKLDELVFQCLMTMNRYEEAAELLHTLETGPVVLDRYWGSGFVYGAVNQVPEDWLMKVHAPLPQPDLCVLVDIPVEESWKRRPERRDRYESQKDMLQKVRDAYHGLFEVMKQAGKNWVVIDGIGSVEEVRDRLRKVVGVLGEG